MKRIFTVLIAILLVSAMLATFVACGSKKTDDAAATSGTAVADETTETTDEFTTDAAVYTESATPVGKTSADVLAYFNTLVNGLKVKKPAMSYNFEINVPDDIKVTKKGDEAAEEIDESLTAINDAAKGIKDMMLENIKSRSGEIAFGNDNSEVLLVKGESWTSALTVEDIDYATIKEVGEYYYITIVFNDIETNGDTEALAKAFDLRDKEDILASAEFAKASEYLVFNDYDIEYSGCKITAKVNRYTDEIENLNYYKSAIVTADVTGAGTLESYGNMSVIFQLEDKADYNMTWQTELPTSPLETATVEA